MTSVFKKKTNNRDKLKTRNMPMMKLLLGMAAAYERVGLGDGARQTNSCASDSRQPALKDSCGVFMKCG